MLLHLMEKEPRHLSGLYVAALDVMRSGVTPFQFEPLGLCVLGSSLYNQTQISVPTSTLRIRGIVKGYSFTPLWSTRFAGRLLPMMFCIRVCHQLFSLTTETTTTKSLRSGCAVSVAMLVALPVWSARGLANQFPHSSTVTQPSQFFQPFTEKEVYCHDAKVSLNTTELSFQLRSPNLSS